MLNSVRRHVLEAEAALEVAQIMRREFGLAPTGATANLCGSVLNVTLNNAISPLGRAIIQVQGGKAILETVYNILHEVNQEQMHGLVSHLLGVSVQDSTIEADLATSNVFVLFRLTGPPPAGIRLESAASAGVTPSHKR